MSARVTDINGWYSIAQNPISRVGVFPYSKKAIQFPGWESDPGGVVMVYRPEEELGDAETVESFKLTPWVDDHAMLGNPEIDPALMPAEQKGVHGTLGEQVRYDSSTRTLFANLKIWSRSLADAIDAGKKELSCGFRCVYEFVSGVFEGQPYQAIQRKIRGNHTALVDHGRMGPGIAVLDHFEFAFDADELRGIEMATKTTRRVKIASKLGVAPAALAATIGMDKADPEALKAWNIAMDAEEDAAEGDGGGSAKMTIEDIVDVVKAAAGPLGELNKALAQMVGAAPADGGEDPDAVVDDMEPVVDAAGAPVMDAAGNPMMKKKAAAATDANPAMAACDAALGGIELMVKTAHASLAGRAVPPVLAAMDEAMKTAKATRAKIKPKTTKRKTGTAMDDARLTTLENSVKTLTAADPVRTAMAEIAGRDKLAKRVSAFVGTFDHAEMTTADVAKYAMDKLGLKATTGQEITAVESYLHGRQPTAAPANAFGMDSAPPAVNKVSDFVAGKAA